ncbi:hypothetical protein [Phenylobacterium sp.]|uniref:hypothetical protein n=1 Tax=Phenylobacterium sp. TaxID=1871053 RepID=UPI001222ACDF|nr:hypothetical protein [Phenylobacterium sp.]THD59649.1 MAG: hypothetical protein E8A12_11500 [Phenylobacterium sp.]
MVWQTEATAAHFRNGVDRAASPDGRFAVMGSPPTVKDGDPRVALASLADGNVLQTFPGPRNSPCHAGAADSRSFWLSGGSLFAVYRLTP